MVEPFGNPLSEEIHGLVKLATELRISELRIEHEDTKIFFKRAARGETEAVHFEQPAHEELISNRPAIVTAPMVGRFYRAAGPDADPLARVGQRIEQGQRLCVIESMMILNDVLSEFDGVLISMLVEEGQGVEYGQPLFEIDQSGTTAE